MHFYSLIAKANSSQYLFFPALCFFFFNFLITTYSGLPFLVNWLKSFHLLFNSLFFFFSFFGGCMHYASCEYR